MSALSRRMRYGESILLVAWVFLFFIILILRDSFQREMLPLVLVCILTNIAYSLFPVEAQFTIPLMIIRLTGLVRHVCIPYIMKQESIGVPLGWNEEALAVELLEMIAVCVGCIFALRWKAGEWYNVARGEEDAGMLKAPRFGVSVVLATASGVLLMLFNREYLVRFFSLSVPDGSALGASGLVSLTTSCAALLVFVFLLAAISRMPLKGDVAKVALSIFVAIVYVKGSSVTGDNVSRWAMIITALISFVFIARNYPGAKKFLLAGLMIALVFSVTFGSSMKFGKVSSNYSSISATLTTQLSYKSLNAYFSGPTNESVGIDLANSIEPCSQKSLIVMFNDVFANCPLLNKVLSRAENQSTTLFNYWYYGSSIAMDQIMPLNSQLFMYFGWLFVIPEALIAWGACRLDIEGKRVNSYLKVFCCVYMSVTLSLLNCVNLSVMLQNFWIHVLPVIVVVLTNYGLRRSTMIRSG